MKVEIIPFEPVHAEAINSGIDQKWLQGWKDEGLAFTLIIDGQIIACAGVVDLGWRRGEAWALLGPLFLKYKKTTFKAIKTYLDRIVKEKQFRRVQALVRPDFEAGKRMMEHLGFVNETPNGMIAYGPAGETFLMYARGY